MNLSKQDQRNYAILAAFVVGAAYFLYSYLSVPDTRPPAAPVATAAPVSKPVRKTAASGVAAKAETAAQLDPTLHMEAMLVTESLVYTGNGRNIFSAGPGPKELRLSIVKPVEIPKPDVGPRPSQTAVAAGPPPIDLKFFGTETGAGGARRAFLLHGEDVFFVTAGDIVQRRYRVVRIDARSILMEDIANSNQQTLPLLAN